MIEVRDNNGVGELRAAAIQQRYLERARSLGKKEPRDVKAR